MKVNRVACNYQFLNSDVLASQSQLSTGLTRGLDESTYIPTRLDTSLKEDVLKGKKKLVVLTGNAGDGKTAFIQLIEAKAKSNEGKFSFTSDNECKFEYNSFEFETLDGAPHYIWYDRRFSGKVAGLRKEFLKKYGY